MVDRPALESYRGRWVRDRTGGHNVGPNLAVKAPDICSARIEKLLAGFLDGTG